MEIRTIPSAWALVLMLGGTRLVLPRVLAERLLIILLDWLAHYGALPATVGHYRIEPIDSAAEAA